VAVAEHAAAPPTLLVASGETRRAVGARNERLDRDAIAHVDAPALGGAVADPLDHAERLVPGDERHAHRQHARVLLGVAAADAAGLDAQEAAVGVDVGNG